MVSFADSSVPRNDPLASKSDRALFAPLIGFPQSEVPQEVYLKAPGTRP